MPILPEPLVILSEKMALSPDDNISWLLGYLRLCGSTMSAPVPQKFLLMMTMMSGVGLLLPPLLSQKFVSCLHEGS